MRRVHGQDALVLLVTLHADEAVVSWAGVHYMFPIRAEFPSFDGGGHWVTVGYVPDISKALEPTTRARQVVSDARTDLFQRCLVVFMRKFIRASELGYPVNIPGLGPRLLVPRVGGLVVDLMEEKNFLALMDNMSNLVCSHCRVRRAASCGTEAHPKELRDVVDTLEAQFFAAQTRMRDPRASPRTLLSVAHSALPFLPVLGAMHGLGTRNQSYFRIISWDALHVRNLGVLRMLAPGIPPWLKAVCGELGAVMAPAAESLGVLNLRMFELGRLCRDSPSYPGYVMAFCSTRALDITLGEMTQERGN